MPLPLKLGEFELGTKLKMSSLTPRLSSETRFAARFCISEAAREIKTFYIEPVPPKRRASASLGGTGSYKRAA